jgi:tRNA-dihydrouridine synthase B
MSHPVFERLGLPSKPVFLAPLAGVSDHPFRRICASLGADLTYVEMLSATALLFESPRTYQMMRRHGDEAILGVQVTGRHADEIGRAVEILGRLSFETIDLNMGCPVSKVTSAGCGSALLKQPEAIFGIVKAAVNATDKPLSVKIRLGWDRNTATGLEVAEAAAAAGAAWITVHGRYRSDDYGIPVDLGGVAAIKGRLSIPVLGNGNLFGAGDVDAMAHQTTVDGVMISRGALGNPWIFREIKTGEARVTLDEWRDVVLTHLRYQEEQYGASGHGAVCMRKHLLWYVKGWPGAKRLREQLTSVESTASASALIAQFADELAAHGVRERLPLTQEAGSGRFVWDPKFEMDRRLDRGVGDDQLSPG